MHFLRVITHFHSPFSFDACDDLGIVNQIVNQNCVDDVREAVCIDHEDVVFSTDHPNNMARYPFEDLFLHRPEDEWILSPDGEKIGNRIHCPDGFTSDWYPGLEGRFIGLGMRKHSSNNQDARIGLYNSEDLKSKLEIASKTGALMIVPHTESRSLEYLKEVNPAAIEIYNFHAYMDPRIRKKDLKLSPLGNAWVFLRYLLDPLKRLDSNYLFIELAEFSPVYFEKWDALQAQGILATGVAGADSHQTIFKQKMSDGERLDSHRRMIRFFSNFILTEKNDEDSVKNAITRGRVYFVIEEFGTPLGMDFHVQSDNGQKPKVIAEMGDQLKSGLGSLVFHLPTLYPSLEFKDDEASPEIWAELIRVDATAHETVVMKSQGNSELIYPNPIPGHYRVHVWIKPHHLKKHLYSKKLADEPFLWVVSNPIHIL